MSCTARDLAQRWRQAWRGRLEILGESPGSDDSTLLMQAHARDPRRVEEAAFETALDAGRRLATKRGASVPLGELRGLLCDLGSPCALGRPEPTSDGALRMQRAPCELARRGPAACDFWREATLGWVLGASRCDHARHRSGGRGDAECVDVLLPHPRHALRHGPVPERIAAAFQRVQRLASRFHSGLRLELVGYSEGVLSYREHRSASAANVSLHTLIERTLRDLEPGLQVREVSPRPVLGPAAGATYP